MRPPLVSEAEVLEAARRIKARGHAVSGWAIRREAGDRGNPGRMQAIWEEKGDASPPAAAQQDVEPTALPAPLLELVATGQATLTAQIEGIARAIYRHAQESADATYRRVVDEMQAAEKLRAHELNLAQASVEATDAELQQRGDELAKLTDQLAEARMQIAGMTERERQALERAQQADAQAADLQGELEGFGRAAQAAAEARAAAEAQTAAMRDEVAHLRAALERAEAARITEASRLAADLAKAQQQVEDARAAHQADAATARQQAAEAQAAHRDEVNRVRQELTNHQGEVTRLLADLDAAKQRQAESEKVTREALGRAGEAAGRATALEEQLRALQQATAVAANG